MYMVFLSLLSIHVYPIMDTCTIGTVIMGPTVHLYLSTLTVTMYIPNTVMYTSNAIQQSINQWFV